MSMLMQTGANRNGVKSLRQFPGNSVGLNLPVAFGVSVNPLHRLCEADMLRDAEFAAILFQVADELARVHMPGPFGRDREIGKGCQQPG